MWCIIEWVYRICVKEKKQESHSVMFNCNIPFPDSFWSEVTTRLRSQFSSNARLNIAFRAQLLHITFQFVFHHVQCEAGPPTQKGIICQIYVIFLFFSFLFFYDVLSSWVRPIQKFLIGPRLPNSNCTYEYKTDRKKRNSSYAMHKSSKLPFNTFPGIWNFNWSFI